MAPIERAARALCQLAGNPENATMDGEPLWRSYLPEARAVIEAIREPSEAMVSAALLSTVDVWNDERDAAREFKIEFVAAIDAVLEDDD